jgi:coenzyme F420-reducing hydrogenase alpha subunit
MTLQGELSISLTQTNNAIHSEITSSRPTDAAKIFTGKTIKQTLDTLPLLFSVCGKAQTVTAINAIESAMNVTSDSSAISQREAIVKLENLRESCLQVLMGWPQFIDENIKNNALSDVIQSLNKLMQSFQQKDLFSVAVNKSFTISQEQIKLWQYCSVQLNQTFFAITPSEWQQADINKIIDWSEQKRTQASRFIYWLNEQTWKYSGHSNIAPLPEINDIDLVHTLRTEQESFISQPSWQSKCYEVSWFNYSKNNSVIKALLEKHGNGIYTRAISRLIDISQLIKALNNFFINQANFIKTNSAAVGLAHTYAARGRLTHYIELDDTKELNENVKVKKLAIIAPTEWNFHPQGVAAKSLGHLHSNQVHTLALQARLLISTIDPCVGYQLKINNEVMP